jgi:hypothetical protein
MDGRTPQAQRFFPARATCRKVIKHVQQELAADDIITYDVTVFTGDRDGAGTDGSVWIWVDGLLNGQAVRSGWTELDNPAVNNFERGATDNFSIPFPSLGQIVAVFIYFRPSGFNSDWFFERVEVNGKSYDWSDWLTTEGYVHPEPLGLIVQP